MKLFELWVRRKDRSQFRVTVAAKDPDAACYKLVRDRKIIAEVESVVKIIRLGDSNKQGMT